VNIKCSSEIDSVESPETLFHLTESPYSIPFSDEIFLLPVT
jgi:hypothetical protein